MKKYLITYTTPDRDHVQTDLKDRCSEKGVVYIRYTLERLQSTSFYSDNKPILDLNRGAGYWLWKPYIIHETLCEMQDGDILLYHDIGDVVDLNIFDYLQHSMNKDNYCLVLENKFPHGEWTKRDCFHYMDCDTEEYWNATQVEAGLSAWLKNKSSINFCKEWLRFCKIPGLLTDAPNTCGKDNLPRFKDHRHDQSILTNLVLKTNPKISNPYLWKYVQNNVYC